MKTLWIPSQLSRKPLCAAIVGGLVTISTPALVAVAQSTANPCAARRGLMVAAACNPCNPCATKKACNPCNPCNPCAVKKACSPCNPCNPCAAKKACSPCNPCNPCGAGKVSAKDFMRPKGVKLASGNRSKLAAQGRQLWNDPSLSTNGLSCNSCHKDNALLNPSFSKPYPHRIAMPSQMAGVGKISADEMVQFCLLVPMQSKTLPWGSTQLAALTAYTHELQKGFKVNPCAAKKACSPCNPCNPCGAGKVCNPCNPCAVKKSCSPCNPCAPKKSPCSPCNPCAVQKAS